MNDLFRVAKVIDGVKQYWNGSESRYSNSDYMFVTASGAYMLSDPIALQKKVKKKKKQLQTAFGHWIIPNQTVHTQEKGAKILSIFNDAYIEMINITTTGEIPLDAII